VTIETSAALTSSNSSHGAFRAWLPSVVALPIAIGVFALAFHAEIAAALRVWMDSTAYNHCFLVLPLTGILLWMRRQVIVSAHPCPTPWALLLLPGGAMLWVAAALLDVLEAEQLLIVALFEVLVLAVLGWRVFRALMAPLLFLFFLVPSGAFLVPSLQRFTAAFAAEGLRLLGLPVLVQGLVIEIPEGSFEVAEACAGLRFLIASVVFGCFFATIVYTSKARRLGFVCLSIIIPILANGLRALGLILLAHINGSAAAIEADHVIYGWVFFAAISLLLIMIGFMVPDRPSQAAVTAANSDWRGASSGLRAAVITIVGLTIISAGPTWLKIVERASAASFEATKLAQFGPGSAWVKQPDQANGWRPILQGADGLSPSIYRDGEITASAVVVGDNFLPRGKPLTRMLTAIADPEIWRVVETGRAMANVGGDLVAINTALLTQQGQLRSVWWFYVIDGQVIASTLEAKLLHARAAFIGGEHRETFVAVSAEAHGPAAENPTLVRFLESFRRLR
jgi:exosortase A